MLKRQFKNSKLRSERISKSLRMGSYFNCIQCSKEFWRKPAEIKTGDCKFCSRQCYQTWQKGKPKLSGFKKDNPRWNGGIATENHINCEVVMSKEYWKSVLGYDNYYSVSNLGNIRRDKASGGTQAGRILHPSITNRGYPQVTLYISGKSKQYTIHTIVMKSFIGEISKGLMVNHKDGVKTNNNLSNLEYVTGSENMKHAYRTGIAKKKLSMKDVDIIRNRYSNGEITQSMLAKEYGVSLSHIKQIMANKVWVDERKIG